MTKELPLRHCGGCKEDKRPSEFSRSKNTSSWCRSCCAASARKWRAANLERARQYDRDRQDRQRTGKAKEWARFYRWLNRHGLRPEDYHAIFEFQDGKCAICGVPPYKEQFLHVDHDHVTGKVRGLLCSSCNMGLGNFGDDLKRLLAAIAYLQNPIAPRAGVLTPC